MLPQLTKVAPVAPIDRETLVANLVVELGCLLSVSRSDIEVALAPYKRQANQLSYQISNCKGGNRTAASL
jgi:hypothetical protein